MARSGAGNDPFAGCASPAIWSMVQDVSPIVLVAAWFALSVPAAVAVGSMLSAPKRGVVRPVRQGQAQPVVAFARR